MSSHRVPGRFPPPSVSPIADAIRERRGARGLTALDGTLLHAPPIAEGWNSLLGAVRTKGRLPGDVRESMILRVAAINGAAYEWIHHEHVGRDHGLTTAQLRVIRETLVQPQPESRVLSPLQRAAILFADASTKEIKVSDHIIQGAENELKVLAKTEDEVKDLLVEIGATVAVYNMVSRFLVSLDVAGASEDVVPWPADRKEYTISRPNNQSLHAVTLEADPTLPYIILVNSLMTNHSMWNPSLSYILRSYNVILYDQRGHGKSTIPSPPKTTIGDSASDLLTILDHLNIQQVAAVIGVSHGGATTLNFVRLHPHRTKCAVVCDTQALSPPTNVTAWNERIALANATEDGMAKLAEATVARWFPPGSSYHPGTAKKERVDFVSNMIVGTDKVGFEAGARALQGYNLVSPGEKVEGGGSSLWECKIPTLLVAGELDAGGKVAEGMKKVQAEWSSKGGNVTFGGVENSGHLPMIDATSKFWELVQPFLGQYAQ